jgi:hypothetical protein
MKTITLQIGNSDDKLTQREWSKFSKLVDKQVQSKAAAVHFSGCSMPDAPWQNACWVFEMDKDFVADLKAELSQIRANYQQDSVAWTEGQTAFV